MGIPIAPPADSPLTPDPDPRGEWCHIADRYLSYERQPGTPLVWLVGMDQFKLTFAVESRVHGWLEFGEALPGGPAVPVPEHPGWQVKLHVAGPVWSLVSLERGAA